MNVRRSILIVDDHQSIRDPLATFMRRYDFNVDTACDGLAMRQLLKDRSYDLIILDVMLPGEDGLSLCGFVTEHIGTPVILLTAMTDQADRVAGLEIGADDYVLKPFDPRELVARVRSVLRRGARRRAGDATPSIPAPEAFAEKRYTFEGWSFDLTTRELHDPGLSPVPLTTAEFHLLRALLENPNRVLSRQQLMDLTQREGAAFFDRSIDTQISRLRKKLESDPRQPRMLKTVRGDGYLLAARNITLAPMKLLPRTLAGQLLALLLLALIVAHLVAVLVLTWLRHDSDEVHPLSAHTIETRVSSAYRAIDSSPESAQRLVQSISLPDSQFRIRPQPFDDGQPMSEQEGKITASLQQRLGLEANPGAANPPVRVHLRMRSPLAASQAGDVDQDILGLLSPAFDEDGSWMLHVDVRLPDGQWLSSWHLPTMLLSHWSRVLSFSIPVGVLPIIVIAVLFGRRIMQPLRMLTDAAQRISRGERSAHLPLSGPEGVREIIDAFNEMQDRLLGVVNDRTRMVAAIGHDLRTPLTSLRIRAELVDDEELRQAMVTTINEMHSMVEEILHFAQDDAMRETTQHVALDALVGEVVEQQRSLGRQVDWSPPPPISYRCRPAHLKRALANLIDNAARYGRVQVRLGVTGAADPCTAGTLRMEIEDQGPGIAPQDMEQAFRPFSRLEVARNGETGGFGLGLAIARSCVRAHGGELKLHNRSEGGLRAVIELPA